VKVVKNVTKSLQLVLRFDDCGVVFFEEHWRVDVHVFPHFVLSVVSEAGSAAAHVEDYCPVFQLEAAAGGFGYAVGPERVLY